MCVCETETVHVKFGRLCIKVSWRKRGRRYSDSWKTSMVSCAVCGW